MTEAAWQRVVIDLARWYGWQVMHNADSRRSNPGWPDLVLAGHGRVIFAELKAEKGRLSAAQKTWLTALSSASLEVCVWRPADQPEVLRVLGPAQVRLPKVTLWR